MARPKKLTVDYFPHNCKHGKTMFILEQRYGNDGYSFWFKLLETLGSTAGHYLDLRPPENQEYLAALNRMAWDTCSEILQLLAKLGAIDRPLWEECQVVWSDNFVDNIREVYRNRAVDVPVKPAICPDSNEPVLGVGGGFLHDKPGFLQVASNDNPIESNQKPQTKLNQTKLNYTTTTKVVDNFKNKGKKNKTKKQAVAAAGSKTTSNIYQAFSQNIHPITPMEHDSLFSFVDDGMEEEVVIWAIKEAVVNGKRNARYICGILNNLQKEGIKTLEGALARQRERINGQRSKPGQAPYKTICPCCGLKVVQEEIFINEDNAVCCINCNKKEANNGG